MVRPVIAQPATCDVSSLPAVDSSVLQFEAAAPNALPSSLVQIDKDLLSGLAGLRDQFKPQRITVTSGYRPFLYQRHLYEISTTWAELAERYLHDGSGLAHVACGVLQRAVNDEIHKHLIFTAPVEKREKGVLVFRKGQPMVSKPVHSAHARDPAEAVDLTFPPPVDAFLLEAAKFNLFHPCPEDKVHFTAPALAKPCQVTASIHANSPVRILVTDPMGRRVGFDPAQNIVVNEFGEDAFYSGADRAQIIDVGDAIRGVYTVSGVGTGAGPYSISFVAFQENGAIVSSDAWAGTAIEATPIAEHRTVFEDRRRRRRAPDSVAPASPGTDVSVPTCTDPPVVTAPPPLDLSRIAFGDLRIGASPLLKSFLESATARVVCGPTSAPTALTPSIEGVPIDSNTVFRPGTTRVMFRFVDAQGRTGQASSMVIVAGDRWQIHWFGEAITIGVALLAAYLWWTRRKGGDPDRQSHERVNA